MTARDASIWDRPVKVRPYCTDEPIRAIQNISLRCPRGTGRNQTRTTAASVNRVPIRNRGGNSPRPAFAIVKPSPQISGTLAAMNKSRVFNQIGLKVPAIILQQESGSVA